MKCGVERALGCRFALSLRSSLLQAALQGLRAAAGRRQGSARLGRALRSAQRRAKGKKKVFPLKKVLKSYFNLILFLFKVYSSICLCLDVRGFFSLPRRSLLPAMQALQVDRAQSVLWRAIARGESARAAARQKAERKRLFHKKR